MRDPGGVGCVRCIGGRGGHNVVVGVGRALGHCGWSQERVCPIGWMGDSWLRQGWDKEDGVVVVKGRRGRVDVVGVVEM